MFVTHLFSVVAVDEVTSIHTYTIIYDIHTLAFIIIPINVLILGLLVGFSQTLLMVGTASKPPFISTRFCQQLCPLEI